MVVMSKYGMRFLNTVIKIRFDRSDHSSIPLAYGAFHFLQMCLPMLVQHPNRQVSIEPLSMLCPDICDPLDWLIEVEGQEGIGHPLPVMLAELRLRIEGNKLSTLLL